MSRRWRVLVLALAVALAQLAFALHGGDHGGDLDHHNGEACVQCLALAGAAPAPPPAGTVAGATAVVAMPSPASVPPLLTFASPIHFLSRAPPRLQS